MGSPARYACCNKEMLGWICEKMVTQELTPIGGRFSASSSTGPCFLGGDCLIAVRNDSWDNAHTSNLFSKGERLSREPSTLVQHAQRTSGSSDG